MLFVSQLNAKHPWLFHFSFSSDLGGFVLPPQWSEDGPRQLVSRKHHPQQEWILEDHGLRLQHLLYQPLRSRGVLERLLLRVSVVLSLLCILMSSCLLQPKYTCKEWEPNLSPLCLPNPEYLAPEYILSVSCDSASDMYSLGVVMHAVFNEGKPVFKVNKHDIFKSFSRQLDQVSRGLPNMKILRCCYNTGLCNVVIHFFPNMIIFSLMLIFLAAAAVCWDMCHCPLS